MSKKKRTSKQPVRLRNTLILLILILGCLILVLLIVSQGKRPVSTLHTASGETGGKINSNLKYKKKVPEETVKKSKIAPAESSSPAGRKEHPKPGAKLVLIIDDAGYSMKQAEPFLKYQGKLTLSILPELPFSREIAEEAKRVGRDIILHCPMEPLHEENPGPDAIYTGQSRETIRKLLNDNFNSVPGAEGTNNHMGSRATSDIKTMDIVMQYLAENKKFFIDSKTTVHSVAEKAALKYKVPYFSRDVFIDNSPEDEKIRNGILKGIAIAERKGYAILIGHVKSPQIIGILNSLSGVFKEKRTRLATVDELISAFKGKE